MPHKILLILILLGIFAFSPALAAEEKILDFNITLQINPDSSINVTEKIIYDFGNLKRHGIYRDIPYKYKNSTGNFNLRLTNFSVTDAVGNPYDFNLSNNGAYKRLKIGDADKLITGQRVYIINYTVSRALNYFDNHDELYWNAIGDKWQIPINNISAKVILPDNTSSLRADCFYGKFGATQKCPFEIKDSHVFFSLSNLSPYQNMTLVVGWPKNITLAPSTWQKIKFFITDNLVVFLPFCVLIIMLILWFKKGRNPQGRGTIIPEYAPPDNLSPAECGALIDDRVDSHDISAEIVQLAILGYLKITRLPKKKKLSSDDYQLNQLKSTPDQLNNFQKYLLESLFENGPSIKISQLKNKFYKDLEIIKKKIYASVVNKKYFSKNPQAVKGIYVSIGFSIIFLSLFFLPNFITPINIVSLVLSGTIVALFSFFMSVKTQAGVLAKEHLLGFKMFLSVTEKDRLKFHNAPQKDPQTFEKFLPYAMVLKVEKEWAQQFEGIYNTSPNWYADPSHTTFSAFYLASALNNFNTRTYSNLSSRPNSAARGGSGFSGGFSGGGFGGGGGGSW